MTTMRAFLLSVIFLMCFAQCTPAEDFDVEDPKFRNDALPEMVDVLRVLGIGNSYTQDCVYHLQAILDSTSINPNRLGVYVAAMPGASLHDWSKKIGSPDTIVLERYAGNYAMTTVGTFESLLSQPWDIIVFQQYSRLSDDFTSFNPYLNRLRRAARQYCTNPRVCFAWNMTWNYWNDYATFPVEDERYFDIVEAARQVVTRNGIDVLIPTGTAIENARNTSLQDGFDLTRDGTHLSLGTGTYVASCTWFERLLMPAFGVSISQTRLIFPAKSVEDEERRHQASVREDNFRLCQQCAFAAIENPYEITYLEERK